MANVGVHLYSISTVSDLQVLYSVIFLTCKDDIAGEPEGTDILLSSIRLFFLFSLVLSCGFFCQWF